VVPSPFHFFYFQHRDCSCWTQPCALSTFPGSGVQSASLLPLLRSSLSCQSAVAAAPKPALACRSQALAHIATSSGSTLDHASASPTLPHATIPPRPPIVLLPTSFIYSPTKAALYLANPSLASRKMSEQTLKTSPLTLKVRVVKVRHARPDPANIKILNTRLLV